MRELIILITVVLIASSLTCTIPNDDSENSEAFIMAFSMPPYPGKEGYQGYENNRNFTSLQTLRASSMDVIGIRVQFQEDDDDTTTGNGLMQSGHDYNYFTSIANQIEDYYDEVSYSKFTLTVTISENLYTLPYEMKYYGANNNEGQRIKNLIEDSIEASDNDIDFSDYDAVMIFHAGSGEESDVDSDTPDDIWSEHLSFWPGISTNDGVQISSACILPETLDQDGVTGTSILGVSCHEFGHELGLPDLYDTDGSSDGIGLWGLMAAGSWLGSSPGKSPAHFCAWSKIFLGWVEPIEVTTDMYNAEIPRVESNDVVYKIQIGDDPDEYFLIENRQKYGYDTYLPGSGLLIWHIDDDVGSISQNNVNTNENHKRVDLEEAHSGAQHLDYANDGNQGDANDPWKSPKEFTPESIPNSNSYDGSSSDISVVNISSSGSVMHADFIIGSAQVFDIDLEIFPSSQNVDPEDSVEFTITATNNGNGDDEIEMLKSGSNADWAEFSETQLTLSPGDSEEISLIVTAPLDALAGEKAVINVQARSSDSSLSNTVVATVTVNQIFDIVLSTKNSSKRVDPEGSVEYSIKVYNNGNGDDEIEMLKSGSNADWAEFSETQLTLSPGDSEEISLTVTAPLDALAGEKAVINVQARSSDSSLSQTLTLTTTVNQVFGVELFVSPSSGSGDPGEQLNFTITLSNNGNGEDTVTLTLSGINYEWGELSDDVMTLQAWTSENLTLRVIIPLYALAGEKAIIELGADSKNATASVTVNITVNRVLRISMMPEFNFTSIEPEEMVRCNITVSNDGNDNDNITLIVAGVNTDWGSLSKTYLALDPYNNTTITLEITVPANTSAFTEAVFEIKAKSKDSSISGNASITIIVSQIFEIELLALPESIDAEPGKKVKYTLTLLNKGNGDDTVTLTLSGINYEWGELSGSNITLAEHSQETLILTVSVPSDAIADEFSEINILAKSKGCSTNLTVLTKVSQVYEIDLRIAVKSQKTEAGKSLTFSITIENKGNGEDKVALSTTGDWGDWGAFSKSPILIPSGSEREVILTVKVPENAKDGDYLIYIVATSGDNTTEQKDWVIVVVENDDSVSIVSNDLILLIPVAVVAVALVFLYLFRKKIF